MGYTNKTSHYDLPQWIAGDKPSWLGDVNTAMLNIDTAIAGADASASAAESSAAAANAQVQAQEAKITKNTTDIQALTEQLANVSGVANAALPKNGGTMTGALTLAGAPTQDLQAATKKYVDDHASSLGVKDSKLVFATGGSSPTGYAQYNTALVMLNVKADITTPTTGAIDLGSGYSFIPVFTVAANVFGLTSKTPTTTGDLYNTRMIGFARSSGDDSAPDVYAYYDGNNTVLGFRVQSSGVSALANKKYEIIGGVIV